MKTLFFVFCVIFATFLGKNCQISLKNIKIILLFPNVEFQSVDAQAAAPNPFTREQLRCIAACPRVANYNPICGSDGFQYENMGHLNCARGCNHSKFFLDFY